MKRRAMTKVNTSGGAGLPPSGSAMLSRRGFLRLASTMLTVCYAQLEVGGLVHAVAAEPQRPVDPARPTAPEQFYPLILRVPSRTRNGAHVPIVVEMHHPMEPDHYIKSIQILNERDPIPSKGVFYFSPTNGQAYLSVQARMRSGTSAVLAIAECNRHGRWATSQTIRSRKEGEGVQPPLKRKSAHHKDGAIRPPVIRIPELI